MSCCLRHHTIRSASVFLHNQDARFLIRVTSDCDRVALRHRFEIITPLADIAPKSIIVLSIVAHEQIVAGAGTSFKKNTLPGPTHNIMTAQ